MMFTLATAAAVILSAGFAPMYESFPKAKIPGTWLLNGNNKSTKFVFKSNGAFSYSGVGATSQGRWSYDDSWLKLTYTEIDGSPVKPGAIVGKYHVSDDGVLTIDRYKYMKAD